MNNNTESYSYVNQYTEHILLQSGMTDSKVDNVPVDYFDESNIPEFVTKLFNQSHKRTLVITTSETVTNIVHAINNTLTKKAFVICNDKYEVVDEAIKEIKQDEAKLVDEEGNEFSIVSDIQPDVLLLDSNNIALSTDYDIDNFQEDVITLTGKDGKLSYFMLPDRFSYVGNFEDINDINARVMSALYATASVAKAVKKQKQLALSISAPVFRSSNDDYIVFFKRINNASVFSTDFNKSISLSELVFRALTNSASEVYLGSTTDKTASQIVTILAESQFIYPTYLLDDIETAFIQGKDVTANKWNNTLERIFLERRRDGSFFEIKTPTNESSFEDAVEDNYVVIDDNIFDDFDDEED